MAKFKVGDKVKIVAKESDNHTGPKLPGGVEYLKPDTFNGIVGFVSVVDSSTRPYTLNSALDKRSNYLGMYNDKEIELAEPAYKTITPKVGKRYQVVKKYEGAGSIKVGDILTFKGKGADNFCKWERDHTTYTPGTYTQILTTEYLELVEERAINPTSWGMTAGAPLTINNDNVGFIMNQTIEKLQNQLHLIYQPAPIKQSLITKSMNFIKKLTQSAADKTLEKAGFTNSCGELTSLGQSALTSLVFQEKKEALVKLAEDVIAEETK